MTEKSLGVYGKYIFMLLYVILVYKLVAGSGEHGYKGNSPHGGKGC